MTTPALPPCSILLLAGGRGQRMGGQDKGLLEWRDRPMIAHLHDLARPLTDDLIISCNRNPERYAIYADRLVHDTEADFPGPLAGILAGLAAARHEQLLVLPCDAPMTTPTLLAELRQLAGANPGQAVMVRHGERWEPLFCLLPRILLQPLQQLWQTGERSPLRALLQLDTQIVPCEQTETSLANFNTPEHLRG